MCPATDLSADLADRVTRLIGGDGSVFEDVYAATIDAIEACAYSMAGPGRTHDAENAVAHVYARWVTNPPRLNDPSKFVAYSRAMVRNFLVDCARNRVRTVSEDQLGGLPDASEPIADLVEQRDTHMRLVADLSDVLGDRNASLLIDREVHRVSVAELARRAGLSVDYLHVLLTECRRKAREGLDRGRYALAPMFARCLPRNANPSAAAGALSLGITAGLGLILLGPLGLAAPTGQQADVTSRTERIAQTTPVGWLASPSGIVGAEQHRSSKPRLRHRDQPSISPANPLPQVSTPVAETGYRPEQSRWAEVQIRVAGHQREISADAPGPARTILGDDGIHLRIDVDCRAETCDGRPSP